MLCSYCFLYLFLYNLTISQFSLPLLPFCHVVMDMLARFTTPSLTSNLLVCFGQSKFMISMPFILVLPDALAIPKTSTKYVQWFCLLFSTLAVYWRLTYQLQPWKSRFMCMQEDQLNWACTCTQCRLWHEKEVHACKYAGNLMTCFLS